LNEISRRVLLENTKRNLLPDTGFVVKNVSSRRSSGISNSMVFQNQRTRPGHTRYEVLLSELAKLKQELLQDVRLVLRATGESMAAVRADLKSQGKVAWKSLSYGCILTPLLSPLGRVASAASLACARSQVVPRIFAVIVGEATWAHHAVAEAEQLQISSLMTQAPYRPAFVLSLLSSLLEGPIMVLRSLFLAMLFTPVILLAPFADSWGEGYRRLWLYLVRFSLEKAGAAFIKWGQWAATRPDLFPKDLCAELSRLHTKAPAHNFAHTRRTVEGAFGRKLHEIFEDFEEEPIASGSIAQVHRAVLRFRYPGQKSRPMVVAVKVRHPGVTEVIQRDFAIINWIAKISGYMPGLQWLRLDESVQQFAVFMLTQVLHSASSI